MLDEARARSSPRDVRPGRRARAARSRTTASTASSPATSTATSREPERLTFLAEARRVARELVVVDCVASRRGARRGRCSSASSRTARAGRSTSAGSPARVSPRARRRRGAPRGPLVRGRPRAPSPRTDLPLARVAEARSARLPRLCRGRLSARVAAGARAGRGAARVSLRAGAGDRRGRGAPAVARPRRPRRCAAGSSSTRTSSTDVLLRVRHALLSGPRGLGARRPHADSGGAAALRVLART